MNWTANNIPDLHGKRALITGANSGIGFEAAKELARKGAEVILAVRNLDKGWQAKEAITRLIPNANLRLMALDLADLNSVREVVEQLTAEQLTLDILINNAGIMLPEQLTLSAQQHEIQWATNHLGHFVLTLGLLPLLERADSPRVVTLSSLVAKFKTAEIYYGDLNFERKYDKMAAYAQSKLANAMFATELQQRLSKRQSKVISIAAHPGYTATNLQQHMGISGKIMNALFAQKVQMGVLPTLRAATDTSLAGGEYIGPMRMANYRGFPGMNTLPKAASDADQRRKLWEVSEQIVGQRFLSPA